MSSKFRFKDEKTNREFVEEPSFPAKQGTPEPKKRTGIITGKLVNARKAADAKSKVMTMLKEGTKVEVLNSGIQIEGFYHVRIKDLAETAYVSSKFCKLS